MSRIDEIHGDFPDGFGQSKMKRAQSTMAGLQDLGGEEMVDFAREEVRKSVRARWKRVRTSVLMMAPMMKGLSDQDHARILEGDEDEAAEEHATIP